MTAHEGIEDQLREAGLRVTQARISVVAALQDLDGHPTADEVLKSLDGKDVVVSRATVFNALDDLNRAGLVMVADAGPGATRYETATAWHHHFVCNVCGSITDVACVEGSPLCVDPVGVDGEVDDAQVIFRGTCASCLQAER